MTQIDSFMVVDTSAGLRIVVANTRNFFSTKYAVQFVGTRAECEREMKRLKQLDFA